jgi:biopolymer transport protein ExbD
MLVIERGKRKIPHLNLTPLIDVIFLLIVFFMLTSKFALDEVMDIGLAPVSSKTFEQALTKGNMVLVLLGADATFKLWSEDGAGDSSSQKMANLQKTIKPLLVRHPEREIIIVVHTASTVQDAVSALEALKNTGAQNVRLAKGSE